MTMTREELRFSLQGNKEKYNNLLQYIGYLKEDYTNALVNSSVGIEGIKILQGKIQILNELDVLLS